MSEEESEDDAVADEGLVDMTFISKSEPCPQGPVTSWSSGLPSYAPVTRMRQARPAPRPHSSAEPCYQGMDERIAGLEHFRKRLPALTNRRVGEHVEFPGPVEIGGRQFTSAIIERDFKSASAARLLRLLPQGASFIFKLGSVQKEVAVMRALHAMNHCWRAQKVEACNEIVQAVTYNIIPLGETEAGLIEAVPDSRTIRELGRDHATVERHHRVLVALQYDPTCLDRLAATTAAYLTACYALGLRDSHDDNIMLRDDGSIFRVDFGYIFGAAPNLDAPPMAVSSDILTALGEARWEEVLTVCEKALVALSGDLDREPPAWACIRSVPEMAVVHNDALSYVRTLSLDAFRSDLQHAHKWSLARAAKNGIRDVVRYITDPDDNEHAELRPRGEPEALFYRGKGVDSLGQPALDLTERELSLLGLLVDGDGQCYVTL